MISLIRFCAGHLRCARESESQPIWRDKHDSDTHEHKMHSGHCSRLWVDNMETVKEKNKKMAYLRRYSIWLHYPAHDWAIIMANIVLDRYQFCQIVNELLKGRIKFACGRFMIQISYGMWIEWKKWFFIANDSLTMLLSTSIGPTSVY